MLRALHLTEEEFDALDIHTRAKIIAEYTLSNISEVRSRHLSILKSNLEKKQKNKGSHAKV